MTRTSPPILIRALCLALLALAAPLLAGEPAKDLARLAAPLTDALATFPWQVQLELPDLTPEGWSAVPFLGRDDKNGFVYGAGLFFYRDRDPGYHLDVYGVSNLDDFHSGTIVHEHWTSGPWRYGTVTTVERAFDYYYGEGDQTSYANPYYTRMNRIAFKGTAVYRLWDKNGVGLSIDHRRRSELTVGRADHAEPGDASRLFPDESGSAVGLLWHHDSRDSRLFPSKGSYSSVTARYIPSEWTVLEADRKVWQEEADLRTFITVRPGWVAALRGLGGTSQGEPGYIWRYRLGGVELLRGYGDNRFRGKHYWAGQAELRFPIYKILTGAAGADVGDAGDAELNRPRASAQAGLRVALPPDYGVRCRFDVGLGEDQHTFQVQFGEDF